MLVSGLASQHGHTAAPDIFVLVEQVQPSGKDGKLLKATYWPVRTTLSHFGLSTTGTQAATSTTASSALGSFTQDFSVTSWQLTVGMMTWRVWHFSTGSGRVMSTLTFLASSLGTL